MQRFRKSFRWVGEKYEHPVVRAGSPFGYAWERSDRSFDKMTVMVLARSPTFSKIMHILVQVVADSAAINRSRLCANVVDYNLLQDYNDLKNSDL